MKIKIALYNGWGSGYYTPGMKSAVKGISNPVERRVALAKYLEKESKIVDMVDEQSKEFLKSGVILYNEKDNGYYVRNPEFSVASIYTIEELDTSRKWGIEDYDGSESICYFDDIEPISEEYNYYRRK